MRKPQHSRFAILVGSLLIASAALAQQPPQFRTTVALVQLQVNVADPDGRFVPGLGVDDFTVEVNGEERPARIVYEVDLRRDADTSVALVDGTPQGEPRQAPRPVAARRHWLLVFDFSFTTRRGVLEARRAALQFVDEQVNPDDLLAVATVNRYGVKLLTPFTANHAAARTAVETLGLFSAGDVITGGVEAEESIGQALNEMSAGRAGTDGGIGATLDSSEFRSYVADVTNYTEQMQEFGKMLQAIDGRKHVVLFSRGFNDRALTGQSLGQLAAGAEARASSPEAFANDPEQMYGAAEVRDGLDGMIQMFRRADAVVHAVDPSGLRDAGVHDPSRMGSAAGGNGGGADIMPTASRTGHQALAAIASGTGGSVDWSGNDLSVALAKIEEATSTFYMIAYRKAEDDPATVDVRVHITRPGVRVVSAPRRLTPPPDFQDMTETQRALQVAEYLNDDVERREIAFDSQVVAFPGTADTSRLVMFLEVSGLELDRLAQLRGSDQVRLEMGGFALGADAGILDSFRRRVTIDVARMRERGAMSGQSFRFTEHLDTPPGEHRLRLLVRETDIGLLSSRTLRYYSPPPADRLTLMRPMILSGLQAPAPQEGVGSDGFDPLSIAGARHVPVASPVLAPGKLFRLLVVAYRVPRDPQSGDFQAGLALEAEDLDGDSHTIRDFKILGSAVDEPSDTTQLLVEARLPAQIRPGSARLWARIIDATNGSRVEEQTPIFVSPQ